MKKHLLKTLLVATGFATVSALAPLNADAQTKKVLNAENYEKASQADWTSPNGTVKLVSGDATYGTYISLNVSGNGNRSGYKSVTFNSDPSGYTNSDLSTKGYTIEFDLCLQSGNVKGRSNSQFIVPTAANPNLATNTTYTGTDFVFSLSQPQRNASSTSDVWYINDLNNTDGKTVTLTRNKWYHYVLNVTATGTAYSISQGASSVAEGKLDATYENIPRISGFFTLLGRGSGYTYFDNLEIYEYAQGEVAQVPSISLEKVNGKQRTYLITFAEGETLHYKLPEATEYVDVNTGTSVEVTTSTSGNLVAYTTNGSATSSEATTKVDASDITLNAPTSTLTGIGEGYEKEYTIAINNDNIPLKPTASLKYVFTPADGSAVQNGTLNNGEAIKSTIAGTYDITASAEGYTDSKLTISNTVAYTKIKEYSFSTMTKEDFANETIWKEGTDTESRWGWSDAKPATKFELQDVETNASTAIEGIELFTNKVPTIYIGYGLMAPNVTSNYGVIKLKNTNDKQYAAYTYLNNYGKNTLTTVQAANADYSLFRFSDILKDIKIYSPVEFANITDAKYATYVTKSAVVVPEDVTVYTVKANTDGIEPTEVKAGTIIPANTAVLLKAETAGDYAFAVSTEAGTELNDNDLKASTGVKATGVEYCLTQLTNGNVGFMKVQEGVEIHAGKAYLEVPAQSASANFFALDDTVTAIKNIETEKTEDNAYYTLQGVKVVNPTKGIYIHNGKKVVIK